MWLKPSSKRNTVETDIDSGLISRLEEYSKKDANGERDSNLLKEIIQMVSDSNKIEVPLIYANDTCVMIGVLRYKLFYGSPGFGEDTAADAKEYSFILELEHPVTLIDTSFGGPDTTTIEKVHVMGHDYKDQLVQFINKRIGLKCTLVPAHTGHHHAPAITWNLVEASEVKY